MLIVPLVSVFVKAFEQGANLYFASITDPIALKAIKLTLITIAITVPINTIFGLAAAWAIAKFKFKGKNILITIIDLPFSISPVVAGLIFVLLFSTSHGLLGPLLNALGIKIIFAPPGIVIATLFVTLPFVARELIPLMEAQGTAEEEAALTLGQAAGNLLVHYAPQYKMGAAVRRYADNCKGGRRVWCGFRCIRAYQRSYQYGSSSC